MRGIREVLRVLVVVDHPLDRDVLVAVLRNCKLVPTTVRDGTEMFDEMAEFDHEVLVLDLRLHRDDATELARAVAATSNIPIVMIGRDGDEPVVAPELVDVVDACVARPLDAWELARRVWEVWYRPRARAPQVGWVRPIGQQTRGRRLCFGGFTLDLDADRLLASDGKPRRLTPNEFALLAVFAMHPHRILSRDELLDRMGNLDTDVLDRTIDLLVMRVRRKIEPDPSAPRYLRTVRGRGYVFSVQQDVA